MFLLSTFNSGMAMLEMLNYSEDVGLAASLGQILLCYLLYSGAILLSTV
ncbi:hypothetical protein AAIG39_14145 [Phytobacter palmae]|uniref:Uncharacterized protein n=1 Tax=Phytobacter palmae TaxID=1855371 RepID=A0ABU9V658_9ENTR